MLFFCFMPSIFLTNYFLCVDENNFRMSTTTTNPSKSPPPNLQPSVLILFPNIMNLVQTKNSILAAEIVKKSEEENEIGLVAIMTHFKRRTCRGCFVNHTPGRFCKNSEKNYTKEQKCAHDFNTSLSGLNIKENIEKESKELTVNNEEKNINYKNQLSQLKEIEKEAYQLASIVGKVRMVDDLPSNEKQNMSKVAGERLMQVLCSLDKISFLILKS